MIETTGHMSFVQVWRKAECTLQLSEKPAGRVQARCHNIFGLYRLIHWVCHLAVPFAFNNRAFRHEHLCIGRVADGRESCACFPDNRFAGLPISEGRAGVWVGVCGRYVSVRGCACVRVRVRGRGRGRGRVRGCV